METPVIENDYTNVNVYIACGAAAALANIIVVFVLFRNKQLFIKSSFIAGLSVGDIINGLALLITGLNRTSYMTKGISSNPVHPLICLKGFTTLWLIGIQLPTVMMLLVGIERVIAVASFNWYYKKWTDKTGWLLTGAVYLYVAGSIGTLWVMICSYSENVTVSLTCATPSVIGVGYGTYNYGMAIICGSAAIVTMIVSLVFMIKKKRKFQNSNQTNVSIQKFLKKQWHITKSMACIAFFDFVMVVIPNMLLLMLTYKFQFPPELRSVGSWSADLVCSRSTLSLFIHLLFNRDFRNGFLKAFGIKQSSVHPIVSKIADCKVVDSTANIRNADLL